MLEWKDRRHVKQSQCPHCLSSMPDDASLLRCPTCHWDVGRASTTCPACLGAGELQTDDDDGNVYHVKCYRCLGRPIRTGWGAPWPVVRRP